MKARERRRRGRGEGSVYFDDARGLWVGSVSLGRLPPDAEGVEKRNRPTAYGKTKREVMDKLDALRRKAGVGPKGGTLTVWQLLDDWRAAKAPGAAPNTQEHHADAVAKLKGMFRADAEAASLTVQAVRRLYAECIEKFPKGRAWIVAGNFRAAVAFAAKSNLIPTNPAAGVALPPRHRREMLCLTPAQARALLAASAGLPCRPLLSVALGSGCRQGELLGLRWGDVDIDAGTLAVRRSLVRARHTGWVIKHPKTPAALRTLALPAFALDDLRVRRSEAEAAGHLHLTVFCSRHGRHRQRKTVSAMMKAAVRRANLAGAGIPEATRFHDLRHSHASILISRGLSLRAVSRRLGHSSPALTLAVYSHVMPGDDERLAGGMQDALG